MTLGLETSIYLFLDLQYMILLYVHFLTGRLPEDPCMNICEPNLEDKKHTQKMHTDSIYLFIYLSIWYVCLKRMCEISIEIAAKQNKKGICEDFKISFA